MNVPAGEELGEDLWGGVVIRNVFVIMGFFLPQDGSIHFSVLCDRWQLVKGRASRIGTLINTLSRWNQIGTQKSNL
jgi:hypothetical protein